MVWDGMGNAFYICVQRGRINGVVGPSGSQVGLRDLEKKHQPQTVLHI